jgi:hypothetical protein
MMNMRTDQQARLLAIREQMASIAAQPRVLVVHTRCRDIGTSGDRPGACTDATRGHRGRPGAHMGRPEVCRGAASVCRSTTGVSRGATGVSIGAASASRGAARGHRGRPGARRGRPGACRDTTGVCKSKASRYSTQEDTFSSDERSRPSPAFRVGSRCDCSMCRSCEICGKRGGVDISTKLCRHACRCWRGAEGAARCCAKFAQEEVQRSWPGQLERPAVPQEPGTQV